MTSFGMKSKQIEPTKQRQRIREVKVVDLWVDPWSAGPSEKQGDGVALVAHDFGESDVRSVPSVPYLPLFVARHACARRVVPSPLPCPPLLRPALLRRKTPARLGLIGIGRCPSPAANAQFSSPLLCSSASSSSSSSLSPLPNRKRFLALRGDKYPTPRTESQPNPLESESHRHPLLFLLIPIASPSNPLQLIRRFPFSPKKQQEARSTRRRRTTRIDNQATPQTPGTGDGDGARTMRLQGPRCSFREGAADMAGAIFMSNSETRDHCFNTGVFGLPPEYAPFVANVKQGMPLFLFDYTFRKLYGVFEAASDGGMDISRTAFGSTGRTYPAQVCFNIVWKCRPLAEDEFFPAIEENYYISKKFYFDLSYQQVVQLYGLFDKKRVEHPICNYSTSANMEKEHSSRRRTDRRSLTPNSPPFSADHSHTLIPSSTPKISTVETNCSASTSMHLIVPPTFEAHPSVSLPLVTKPFGVQTAPIHSNPIKLPYHSHEHHRDVSAIDGTSTQVSAPCSQTARYHQDQFVANQSYPLSDDYPHNNLSSGCMMQGPSDGVRLSVKQSSGGSSLSCSRYLTQVPTGDERSYLTSTPYFPSYHDSSSPQRNAHWKDDYDINCEQCKEMYASEHLHLNRGKSVTPPDSRPAYHEAPEVSTMIQHKESFTGYIPIHDRPVVSEKEHQRRDFNCDGSVSSGSGHETLAYISDRTYTDHDVGGESNKAVPSQRPQKNVFSRLSVKPQLSSQEITGPSMNQLLYLLSQRTKQWSNKSTSPREDGYKQLVREQDMDMPCPPAELNLPSGLEGEESADPPFLNFKRRSKAAGLDTDVGKEVSGKKRRKLVRPSFGENNTTGTSGNDLQGNAIVEVCPSLEENNTTGNSGNDLQGNAVTEVRPSLEENNTTGNSGNDLQGNAITERNQSPASIIERNHSPAAIIERNHSPVQTDGSKFIIDLNEPASVESDMVEDGSIAPCPAATNIQTEKSCEVGANKQNCSNSTAVISKQDVASDSGAPTEKITLDLNITDLNTLDESKLQAILGSSLLQALDKLRNSKSNDSNKAKSSPCEKNKHSEVKMEMKSDTSAKYRCN